MTEIKRPPTNKLGVYRNHVIVLWVNKWQVARYVDGMEHDVIRYGKTLGWDLTSPKTGEAGSVKIGLKAYLDIKSAETNVFNGEYPWD